MNAADAIVLAMAAAAAARFRPNPFFDPRPEEDAYLALRRDLAERFSTVPADILDIGPGSPDRQAALKAALEQSGAADDAGVRQAAGQLARLVAANAPESAAAVMPNPASLQAVLQAVG